MRTRFSSAPAVLSILLATACGGGAGGAPPPQRRAPYFTIAGKQQFVASRNVTGRTLAEITALLDAARDDGTRLVRVHVTHGSFGMGITPAGAVEEAWAESWDQVFAHAEADGLQVIPVFGVWADWNDGSNGEAWHAWDQNPLNRARGGPAASPAELYQAGSAGQRAWLRWLGRVVGRWQRHGGVAAWEVFSELDLVTWPGERDAAFDAAAVAFYEAAAARVRAADPARRPVTASASGGRWNWPALYRSEAMELVQVHLYGPEWELDTGILQAVGTVRQLGLGKPILLGESGLDWRSPKEDTLTTAPEGPIATRHAVWAALVSGAMNGRALWWEDGYAVHELGDPGLAFVTAYPAVEAPALKVLAGRDLTDAAPLPAVLPAPGGVLGFRWGAIGWVRAATCAAPDWDCDSDVPDLEVQVDVPDVPTWLVYFHDAVTGEPLGEPITVSLDDQGRLRFPLPTFRDGVAFVLAAAVP